MVGPEREPLVGDAFGSALLAAFEGFDGEHTIERDDGQIEVMGTDMYFAGPTEWSALDVAALDLASGRVLDVGAGAGRYSLALQERGQETVGLDVSPGAVEVCRLRGVEHVVLGSIHSDLDEFSKPFDSILLMGHGLGLLESCERTATLFGVMRSLLGRGGAILGTGLDPYATDDPLHHAYHDWNRERGRLPGQIRLRVRYRHLSSGWFDWLFVSPDELARLASASGWMLDAVTNPDPEYLAVLRPN